ncbi:hypothetical protein KM043_006599 [Ampulex compressa]|nr:hypothetical protein KM043_006599 [Ampulex compressa]
MAVIITTKGGGTREGAEAEESAKGMDCHKFKQELTFGVGLFPQVGARICIALSVDTAGEERVSVQSVSGCALVKKGTRPRVAGEVLAHSGAMVERTERTILFHHPRQLGRELTFGLSSRTFGVRGKEGDDLSTSGKVSGSLLSATTAFRPPRALPLQYFCCTIAFGVPAPCRTKPAATRDKLYAHTRDPLST